MRWTPENYEQALGALEESRKMNTEKLERIVDLQAQVNKVINVNRRVAGELDLLDVSTNRLADNLDRLAAVLREVV
jgi:predicted nuclease with TOPRIM domain